MTTQELAAVRDAGPTYIDRLLNDLHKHIPEYADWLRRGVINENPNKASAQNLHRLADNYIAFTKEHLDLIVKGLDHADPGVVQEINVTLVQTFGIWFVEGEDWVYKSEEIRRPHKEAWRKFWNQNRDRYGKNLPWVINDLSMEAQVVTNGVDKCVEITITNHGETEWRVYTEVAGRLDPNKPREPGGWEGPFSLFTDGREERPIMPAAYFFPPRAMSLAERAALHDRPAHLDRLTIPAGKSYTYVMKLTESFPQLNNRPAYTNLVVRYAYGLYGTHKENAVWRGELRSLPIHCEVKR